MTTHRNRIPREYFTTSGFGESDITVHAGSYHLALRDAGIEMCNIMRYSSIMPAGVQEIPQDSYQPVHGEVMECIEACASGGIGQRITAGIIRGTLVDRNDPSKSPGGLVCEYSGTMGAEQAEEQLEAMLNELYRNGYDHHDLKVHPPIVKTAIPAKKHGTVLVAMCFTKHDFPEEG